MDFGGLLVLGIVWLVFNLLSRGRADARRGPRQTPQPPLQGPVPPGARPPVGGSTQREGSRLEQLLRELERNLEQAGAPPGGPQGRPAATRLPDAEEVEERETLEQPENVVSLETEVVRPSRPRYDYDDAAEAVVRRRIAAADARSGELTKADHTLFDQRIRQQPANHTAVRRYARAQLRDAIIWREILGPPVSERDPYSSSNLDR